ncbi:MAG: hypothetical protein IKW12_02525, partial [Clostridia bacterium]|nr:hypothetical protein [Clostridia bacterium]
MKKLFAVIIALAMLLSFAACGKDTPQKPKTPSGDSDTGIEASLFSVDFGGDWINDYDEFEDEDEFCTAVLKVLDPEDEDYYLIEAVIEVAIDEPYDFREDLVYYDFNQYEYKENNAYETVNIGGVDLLRYDDGEETLIYFNRVEGASATVYIKFDAVDISDSRIDELLEGITFNLEDIGNVDGPWEWEGEEFYADDASVNAGAFTVETQFVPFESPITTFDTFEHSVAAIGDRIYVLTEGELNVCHYNGTELVFVEKIDLPEDDYDRIESTSDGRLWVSGGMNDILCIKDGNIVATYEDIDNLAIHPS